MSRWSLGSVLLLLVFLSTGCEESNPPEPTFTVRDSAGVEIIESYAPSLGRNAWTISATPVVQIGKIEGEDAYLLAEVPFDRRGGHGGTFRLPDGRIVVADRMERTVRIFDAEGKYLSQFGRNGAGPGEFTSAIGWAFFDGEHIAVVQARRIQFFDPGGQLIERFDPPTRSPVYGFFPDRAVLLHWALINPFTDIPIAGVHTDLGVVSIVNADGTKSEWTDTIMGQRMVTSLHGDFPISTSQPFGPVTVLRATAEGFVYGWGDEYDLKVFGRDGNLKRIIRQAWKPDPVTEKDKAGFNAMLGEGVDAQNLKAGMVFPESKAAFDYLHIDLTGYFWVRTLSTENLDWDVFDPSGQWVTTMKLPSGFQVHEIGTDYILGVWKDEFDVNYVRMYSLDRGG